MRSRIVDVAHGLFARRGIDGVSIAEIADASGVSKANVMHHFSTKDRLYAACLDVIDAHLHAAADAAAGGTSPLDDVASAIEAWGAEHPDDLRVMAYGLLRLPEHGGRWALSGPVTRMIDIVATEHDGAESIVIDLLGTVTYREMARPLVDAPDFRSERTSTTTTMELP